jgi:hypothetical protein
MESLGYKQKNKMVYQMIENMKAKSIDFDQFLDMMTARIVSGHAETATKLAALRPPWLRVGAKASGAVLRPGRSAWLPTTTDVAPFAGRTN